MVFSRSLNPEPRSTRWARKRHRRYHFSKDVNCACQAGDVDLANTILAEIGSVAGDADGNGTVDFADVLVLSNNFGEAGQYTDGDFDWNGLVEFPDFLILSNNFGQSGAAASAAVPEPNAAMLLLVGLAALGRRRSIVSKKVWQW